MVEPKIKIMKSIKNSYNMLINNFPSVDQKLQESEMYLNIAIQDVTELYQKATNINEQIISMGEESDEVFMNYISSNLFFEIRSLHFKHSTHLHELHKSVASTSSTHDNTFHDQRNSTFQQRINVSPNVSVNHPELSINLPSVHITPFDGSYEKWADFRDNFLTHVHENNAISAAAKVKILQSLLKDSALKVLKKDNIKLRGEDYAIIWERLNKRYNHKRSLVYSYFKILFEQPAIDKETAESLRDLHDTTFDALGSLGGLGLKTSEWGDLLLYIIRSKLPTKTKELWNEKLDTDELPKFGVFMEFLENRFRTMEENESTMSTSYLPSKKQSTRKQSTTLYTSTKPKSEISKAKQSCKCCSRGNHALRHCNKFKALSLDDRKKIVSAAKLCENCFSSSHMITSCTSQYRCFKCSEKHHSLLHPDDTSHIQHEIQPAIDNVTDQALICSSSESDVLFPTALVLVKGANGCTLLLRAIIDACSDKTYISEQSVKRLQIKTQETSMITTGLGGTTTGQANAIAEFEIESLIKNNFKLPVKALVLPKISSDRPIHSFSIPNITQLNVKLADPKFNSKSRIDLLLGGQIESRIKMSGLLRFEKANINLQETKLGWIVTGTVQRSQCFISTTSIDSQDAFRETLESLDTNLKRFWELEDMPKQRIITKDEAMADDLFETNTQRLPSGRYVVSLPFKSEIPEFSNMRQIALSRFLQLERKLQANPKLNVDYKQCLQDYIAQGHMVEIDPNVNANAYYIPHHCVIKESSSTTKLRVVFDASAKDSNLMSLNGNLLVGPRLQPELLDLLLRFRLFKVALSADIQQMYRQVQIHERDKLFHLILWRNSPAEEIKTYVLNTVTFGTASAPYLAVKTLLRLSEDERVNFPLGSMCLKKGFYVDDLIFGADNVEQALKIQDETIGILKAGGFHLRKWSSNEPNLLRQIPECDRETKSLLDFDSNESIKTLGIQWSPGDDSFHYSIQLSDETKFTKRTLVSDVARIFDPLGWISPTVIRAKIMIQSLWKNKCDWDDPLPKEVENQWVMLRKELVDDLHTIKIKRWLGSFTEKPNIELHGFADASLNAFCAVVYVKSYHDHEVTSSLLFAKTKVAPLKQISLPRLELMAAVLLSKMIKHSRNLFDVAEKDTFCYTDSLIALSWLKDVPHKRTVFVANRITEIQNNTDPNNWYHVDTIDNPADLGTRGISSQSLALANLWWNGPQFLLSFSQRNVFQPDETIILPEEDIKAQTVRSKLVLSVENFLSQKRTIIETASNLVYFSDSALNKFSTLGKLIRTVAYCKRVFSKNKPLHVHISPKEYDEALMFLIQLAQRESYSNEIELIQNKALPKSNSLYNLNPMYQNNLLRVNGRLANANHLSYDQRFPIILPYNHVISTLIAEHAHKTTLHGTKQQALMIIIQRYYIIRASVLVKKVINRCVICYRYRCKARSQQMGQLPESRIRPSRPFSEAGVDYAGPIEIKKWKGRCNSFIKGYFAIFVCFSTKAYHLEVVSDMSSNAFVAAYRRFISRRGIVKTLHSDCGSNFIGSERIITRSMDQCLQSWNEEISAQLSEFHTTWNFNPPASPHFGGVWEAGVKAVKHHLKRVMGNSRLSYEELETFLLQVEACLNSRPLFRIDSDPETIIITPAHFLIQDSLLALPDMNHEHVQLSSPNRWNYIQGLVQCFWKVYNTLYLNSLLNRQKWREFQGNLKVHSEK